MADETRPRLMRYGDDHNVHTWQKSCPSFGCKEVETPPWRLFGTPRAAAPEKPPRQDALEEAVSLITGDRSAQYGPPTQDFSRAADLLDALGYMRVGGDGEVHDIQPSDVAIIVMQVKMSRLMHSRKKRDSWVDVAGYAGCGYECAVQADDD